MIIGLTGMYCAGKNYAAALLEERGLPVLDVDKLGHQVIEAEKAAIAARFGPAILGEDGSVDRRRLGAKVFGKAGELAALEEIVHPGVNRLTGEWIEARTKDHNGPGKGSCVINAALLHRSSAFERLDFIIFVRAPLLVRLLRARRRDGLSWRRLCSRFASQRQFAAQYFKATADTQREVFFVNNRGYFTLCACRNRRMVAQRIDAVLVQKGIRVVL